MSITTAESELQTLGAAELARQLATGAVTAAEVAEACLARIESVAHLRAMTHTLPHAAKRDAEHADRLLADCRANGAEPPPLCGVPVTIKDCFDVAGTPATLGIDTRTANLAAADSPLVARLRASGAVLLGKTNVPQAMMLHCCDNPVFGRTLHPADPTRGPGGSSGGEAAIVAAGASPIGLGSDLGGSIRQPAHACGLVGFKPTSGRLTNVGSHRGLQGMHAIAIDSGPICRAVEDADLMMQALVGDVHLPREHDESFRPWQSYREVDLSQLGIAVAPSDEWFAPCPTAARAVAEAAAAIKPVAADIAEVSLPTIDRAMQLYLGLLSADGFRSIRRMLRGSRVDWQIRRQGWYAGLPRAVRPVLSLGLRLFGQQWFSKLLSISGPRSADVYWQWTHEARLYANSFWDQLDAMAGRRIDALLLPPHALPALRHGTALDLLPAASYCYLGNLLGAPAGVVPWTRVREEEQHYPHGAKLDLVAHLARKTMHQSAGLPFGVQVIARPWHDAVALAVMAALERQRPIAD